MFRLRPTLQTYIPQFFKAISVNHNRRSGSLSSTISTNCDKVQLPPPVISMSRLHVSSEQACHLSENVVGTFSFDAPTYRLPLKKGSIDMRVAQLNRHKTCLMSKGLFLIEGSKIETRSGAALMDVQILLKKQDGISPDKEHLEQIFEDKKSEMITHANAILSARKGHGCSVNARLKFLKTDAVLELTMNTVDSMGAAMVNRLGTEMKDYIESTLHWRPDIVILSNDVPERWAEASVRIPTSKLIDKGVDFEKLQSNVLSNHRVMLGIHGAATPLFQDLRGINEAVYIQNGSGPLLKVVREGDDTVFSVNVSMPLGTAGRPRIHPSTDQFLTEHGNPNPMIVGEYVVACGLLSGLGGLIDATPSEQKDSKTTGFQTRQLPQKEFIKGFGKLSFEERRSAVGFYQNASTVVSINDYELPLSVCPVLLNVRYSDGESQILNTHLYGVTEEKTVSLAMAVASKIIQECGGVSLSVRDTGISYNVDVSISIPEEKLGFTDKNGRKWSGVEVIDGIERVLNWEAEDPRRAVTGGKGEQNGGPTVAIALGADNVKIMQDFSYDRLQSGTYLPCISAKRTESGMKFEGTYTINKDALEANTDHPTVNQIITLLGNPDPETRASMIASGFVLSRFMAVRMLGTFGVDVGHRQVESKG